MIESRKIRNDSKKQYKLENYIDDMTAFGWQVSITKEKHSKINENYYLLIRDTEVINYNQYKSLEEEYEEIIRGVIPYAPVKSFLAILLLLLGIVPGIIYLVSRAKKQGEIEKHNNECYSKMREIVTKARSIK